MDDIFLSSPVSQNRTDDVSPTMTLALRLVILLASMLVTLACAAVARTTTTNKIPTQDEDQPPDEPFPDLFGFDPFGRPSIQQSPDPLVSYSWDAAVNTSELQIYRVLDVYDRSNHTIIPVSAADIVYSTDGVAVAAAPAVPAVAYYNVSDSVIVQIDWGVERAAWLEFRLVSATTDGNGRNESIIDPLSDWDVEASLSEFNTPYPGKKMKPIRYGTSYFRLETNKELYEGVRFTWIYLTSKRRETTTTTTTASTPPLILSDVTLVAKVKPIAYDATFQSSNDRLTQIWYTGAYGVRLNMEGSQFNSILVDRGDRVAIQGDGHPTMATALTVFGRPAYDLVWNQLLQTNSGHVHGHHVVDDSIMAYPFYWVGTVLDWYWATGDHVGFQQLVPDILSIVDLRIADFLKDDLDIGWMGWDDRLGNGWCFHYNNDRCPREGLLTFAALVVKVVRDVQRALSHLPDGSFQPDAEKYKKVHSDLVQHFRTSVPEYPQGLGVHAAANALSSGIATSNDVELWMNTTLNDEVTICSWSAFNQYWILQGFAAADQIEKAIASIHRCWGNMLDTGRGCFFELSSPDWPLFRKDGDRLPTMPSLCHPWASGVTAWMSSTLLGIQPVSPGYSKILLVPYVSRSNPHVKGTTSTPNGAISIEANWQSNTKTDMATMTVNFTAPMVSTGHVGFQGVKGACHLQKIEMEGVTVAMQSSHNLLSMAKYHTENVWQNLKLARVPSGLNSASFRGTYFCKNTNQLVEEDESALHQESYPATITLDRISQGDGLLEYGSDGFLLFGAGNGDDVRNLPNFVSSVHVYNHGFHGSKLVNATFVGSSDSDPTFLPFCRSRSLGVLGAGEDTYWNPGIVVDVNTTSIAPLGDKYDQGILVDVTTHTNDSAVVVRDGQNSKESVLADVKKNGDKEQYKLSVYCVAIHPQEAFAIRVMDLSSLNVIAPTRMIDHHGKGVWWTVEYHSSIRLRIMGIYGMHISALAFSRSKKKERNGGAVMY